MAVAAFLAGVVLLGVEGRAQAQCQSGARQGQGSPAQQSARMQQALLMQRQYALLQMQQLALQQQYATMQMQQLAWQRQYALQMQMSQTQPYAPQVPNLQQTAGYYWPQMWLGFTPTTSSP
jgi:hypothetical protein